MLSPANNIETTETIESPAQDQRQILGGLLSKFGFGTFQAAFWDYTEKQKEVDTKSYEGLL